MPTIRLLNKVLDQGSGTSHMKIAGAFAQHSGFASPGLGL